MIITVDGVEYNATPIAEGEIATERTVVKDGVAYQLAPLPVINKVQVNGVVYDIEDVTIGSGLRHDDNGAIAVAPDNRTIKVDDKGQLAANLGLSLRYDGEGIDVALSKDCIIGTGRDGLDLRVGTGLAATDGSIRLNLGTGIGVNVDGAVDVLLGSGLAFSYDGKIVPVLGSGLAFSYNGYQIELNLGTELTSQDGNLGIRLDSRDGMNSSGLEKSHYGLKLKSAATLVGAQHVAPIVMLGSNKTYGIEVTDAIDDTSRPVMSKAVKSALENLSRSRSLVATKDTLSSGETLELSVPQCYGTMAISLSAGIRDSFNELLLSFEGVTITATRSSITVSDDGEDVRIYELSYGGVIGTLDDSTLTLEFTLSRYGNDLAALIVQNRPLIGIPETVCQIPWPTGEHLNISVSGNLISPCLSCTISSGDTLVISDQRASMSYARMGMTLAGFAAMTSSQALALFKDILSLSRPNTAAWYIGSADNNSTYADNAENFIKECDARSVTPVICTIPSTPTVDNTEKNRLLRAMPCRIIDIAAIINGGKDYVTASFDYFTSDGTLTSAGFEAVSRIINSSL